jgi:hypothetical protein
MYSPFTEVLDTFRSENVVIPLPRELRLHKALGGQTLHSFDDLQIGDIEFFVLCRVKVFFGDQDTL